MIQAIAAAEAAANEAGPGDPPKGKKKAKDVKKISGIAGYYATGVYDAAKITQSDVYFKAIKFGRTYDFIPSTYSTKFKQVGRFAKGIKYGGIALFGVGAISSGIIIGSSFAQKDYGEATKELIDLGRTSYMTFGGPVGLFCGMTYSIVDKTVGWPTMGKYQFEIIKNDPTWWRVYNR